MNTQENDLYESFVATMIECIREYSNGRLSETVISVLAAQEVRRLDFNNAWQMHKGLGYFAKKTVDNYLNKEIA